VKFLKHPINVVEEKRRDVTVLGITFPSLASKVMYAPVTAGVTKAGDMCDIPRYGFHDVRKGRDNTTLSCTINSSLTLNIIL
jgi:hypothetical protein